VADLEATQVRPHIGVISDCALQRHVLQNALIRYGLNVAVICDPSMLEDQQQERVELVDCWLLELDDEDFESVALDHLIDQAEVPVLFGLGKAPPKNDENYISWERRLFDKLEEHLGSVEIMESEASLLALDINGVATKEHDEPTIQRPVAKEVWVLAASLGGPAAVKEFLDEMPADIPVSFLYAQHIDAHFSHVLTKVLGRHSHLDLKPIEQGACLRESEVSVVPVDNEVVFNEDGVTIQKNAWDGPYGPSIDHLLANLLRSYGARCHVIVFSGMGNDGALLAPRMQREGCAVWTQTPESCANGSMPQSIIDLECTELTATPKVLAQTLIKRLGCLPKNSSYVEQDVQHKNSKNLN